MTKHEFMKAVQELVAKAEGVNFVYLAADTLVKRVAEMLTGQFFKHKAAAEKTAAHRGPDREAGNIMLSTIGGKVEQDKT